MPTRASAPLLLRLVTFPPILEGESAGRQQQLCAHSNQA